MQNTDYGKQRTENSHEVRFCYEKFGKAKYFRAIFGVAERATREHREPTPREHSTIYAQETSRYQTPTKASLALLAKAKTAFFAKQTPKNAIY